MQDTALGMDVSLRLRIRETYKEVLPHIIKTYPRYDPYFFDFSIFLTPIERNVWGNIRYLGIPIQCWQFPVLQYFIDFADPVKKIGIEVDGKEWHIDCGKDDKRQKTIEKEGCAIYRIDGGQTYKSLDDYLSEDEYQEIITLNPPEDADRIIAAKLEHYYCHCSEGILRKIKEKYYPEE